MLILIQLQYCQFYLLQVSLSIKLYHIKVFCSIEIHGNFIIGLKRGREENSFTRNTPCELKCSVCSYSQTERAFLFCFKMYSTKQHFIFFLRNVENCIKYQAILWLFRQTNHLILSYRQETDTVNRYHGIFCLTLIYPQQVLSNSLEHVFD